MVRPLLALGENRACQVLLEQEVCLVAQEKMVGMDCLGRMEPKEEEDTMAHKACNNVTLAGYVAIVTQLIMITTGYYGARGPPGKQGDPGSQGPQGQRGNSATCILNSQTSLYSNCEY